MKVPAVIAGSEVTFLLTTLCNHGAYGDYQAFPTRPLALDVLALGRNWKAAGAEKVRTDGQRLALDWHGVAVTLFPSGRIVLEHVVPDRTAAAAEVLTQLYRSV